MAEKDILVDVRNLKKHYPLRKNFFRPSEGEKYIKAVDGISFQIEKGKSLGIAGESGCGKSTTGQMLLRLLTPTSGQFIFNGSDVANLKGKEEKLKFRKQAQLMFQNPFDALNPRFTILKAVIEPLIIQNIGTKSEQIEIAKQTLERVHLKPVEQYMNKFPHEMSGGQLQRVVLARALVIDPIFLVADEPVSMLDVSVRAGVLNLMKEIRETLDLTTIYISHDLSLIQYMCEETAIMYLGKIVEKGPTEQVLKSPKHPYTKALISAVPDPDPTSEPVEPRIKNHVPNPINLPPGCLFQDRCFEAIDQCKKVVPDLIDKDKNHQVACHLV